MQGYLICNDRSGFDCEFKQRRIIEVFQKEEAANYSQRSYDQISYVWHRRISDLNFSISGASRPTLKLLPENTDGEVW